MKKTAVVLLITVLLVATLTSCGSHTPPTPFADVCWGDSADTVSKTIGKSPTSEYDDDEGKHYLSYENFTYDEFNGEIVFGFKENALFSVRFIMSEYDQAAYDHFNNLFDSKYKSYNDDEKSMGKVWTSKDSMVTLMGVTLGVGRVIVFYVDLASRS